MMSHQIPLNFINLENKYEIYHHFPVKQIPILHLFIMEFIMLINTPILMIQLKLKKRKIKSLAGMDLEKKNSFFFYLLFRACRLRKKAQHEANKLKLHGLNEEHSKPYVDLFFFLLRMKKEKGFVRT